jgi:hypothetical protein
LHPIIVGFCANDAPAAQELPLWQAATGFVFRLTHSTWYGWANIVSLIAFATCLWPYFQLARQYAGDQVAWWSLVFFLAEPIIVMYAGLGSTDGFSLVLTIWFIYFADRMIRSADARWWLPTALLASLAAVSKAPFFMSGALCAVAILFINRLRAVKPWILLATAGAAAAAVFIVWTRHTNSLLAQLVFPFKELRISKNPDMIFWWFGDFHYRLSPGEWMKGVWRFLHGTVGSLPLAAILALALIRRGNSFAKLWLLATLITTLVFTHVVLFHWHYYLMCCPAVALLCGSTLARWEDFLAAEAPRRWMRLSLIGLVLAMSTITGFAMMKPGTFFDRYPQHISEIIRRYTKPEDRLVIYGGTWGGEELFRTGRRGFYVVDLVTQYRLTTQKGLLDMLNTPENFRRLKELGYNKLVMISESPTIFASHAVNVTGAKTRDSYPRSISPTVDAWPVVYQSDDVIIKTIP